MREFSDAVVDFVFDFVVADVRKTLDCTDDEAREVLHKSFSKRCLKVHGNSKKVYYKQKSPVVAQSPVLQPEKRIKGQYSNQNAWDKYR